MIKLVALDMDGTLLRPDGTVSDRNARIIRRLMESEIQVMLCTGRPHREAMAPLKERGLSLPAICLNGAAVYDENGILTEKTHLTERQVRDCIKRSEGESVLFDFTAPQGSMTTGSKARFREILESGSLYWEAAPDAYERFCGRFQFLTEKELFGAKKPICKISVFHEKPDALLRIKPLLQSIPSLAVTSSGPNNLELTHVTAQKGTALAACARRKGIPLSQIMAVGDSDNDCSMLSMDLGFAVVMENGSENAKRAAQYQTASNAEDGVAQAVEALILSRQAAQAG